MRTDFGFKGFVLSDWWAMPPSQNASTDTSLLKTFAAEAVKAGMDVDLPWALSYGQLEALVQQGVLTAEEINTSAKHPFKFYLKRHKFKKSDWFVDFYKNINVAFGGRLAASNRTK